LRRICAAMCSPRSAQAGKEMEVGERNTSRHEFCPRTVPEITG
jgi:hypothetical protein